MTGNVAEVSGAVMDRAVDGAVLAGSAMHDMSMWGLFLQADMIVKTVMLMLIFASVWGWAIIINKRWMLAKLNRRADRFEDAFWSGEALDKLYTRVKKNPEDPMLATFIAGMDEWQAGISAGIPSSESVQASLKQRVERAMTVALNRELQMVERGMTFLASVGSTAPFIGLFGTVWGIMNSFNSIAQTNNTSLAVVAPGIAEALFATAIGLVAAIPAVLAYNVFSTAIGRYGDRLDGFVSEYLTIVSRHLDQMETTRTSAQSTTKAA